MLPPELGVAIRFGRRFSLCVSLQRRLKACTRVCCQVCIVNDGNPDCPLDTRPRHLERSGGAQPDESPRRSQLWTGAQVCLLHRLQCILYENRFALVEQHNSLLDGCSWAGRQSAAIRVLARSVELNPTNVGNLHPLGE